MRNGRSLIFSLILVGALHAAALGQQGLPLTRVSSLELSQVDVQQAFKSLFSQVNGSCQVSADLQGQITASLKNVSFDVALQNLLRQVNATYTVHSGIYSISKKQAIDRTPPPGAGPEGVRIMGDGPTIRRIKIRSADPEFIAMMLGARRGQQNFALTPENSTIEIFNNSGLGPHGKGLPTSTSVEVLDNGYGNASYGSGAGGYIYFGTGSRGL